MCWLLPVPGTLGTSATLADPKSYRLNALKNTAVPCQGRQASEMKVHDVNMPYKNNEDFLLEFLDEAGGTKRAGAARLLVEAVQ